MAPGTRPAPALAEGENTFNSGSPPPVGTTNPDAPASGGGEPYFDPYEGHGWADGTGFNERTLGVDTVQITPQLLTESTSLQTLDPGARLTVGKRISTRAFLTYARSLRGAQHEVILLEYDQSDRLSWIISRNSSTPGRRPPPKRPRSSTAVTPACGAFSGPS